MLEAVLFVGVVAVMGIGFWKGVNRLVAPIREDRVYDRRL